MTASDPRPFPALPETIESIHIIGICGSAMGSLAAMLTQKGFTVRGSDANAYPPMSTWLEDRNIDIMVGYDAANLDWEPDLVIVGNVCRESYADAVEMRRRGLPYLSLPEALRHFIIGDQRPLVITGTHGKTTTTSMLAWILADAGEDPGFMLGGIAGNFGTNYRLGDGDAFVIEGDEYDTAYFDKVPKFWHYAPFRATINNLEYDHADIYPDLDAIKAVFRRFVTMLPSEGSLWINGEDPRLEALADLAACPVRTFGLDDRNDLHPASWSVSGGTTTADLLLHGRPLGSLSIPTIGEFNLRNALGATALALDEGLAFPDIADALARFKPAAKRQQLIDIVNDIAIYDDFAHHPTAVKATLKAFRDQIDNSQGRLWALFEATSNTSRRRVFQHQYPPAFAPADEVIIASPRQKSDNLSDHERIDVHALRQDIADAGPHTRLIPDVSDIVDTVSREATPGDIVVGLSGAAFGGIHKKLVDALKQR